MNALGQLHKIAKDAQDRADSYGMSLARIGLIAESALSDADKLAAIKGELEASRKRTTKA